MTRMRWLRLCSSATHSSPVVFRRLITPSNKVHSCLSLELERRIDPLPRPSVVNRCFSSEKAGPLVIYDGMVLRGDLHHDANQHKVAVALDELLGQMREHELQMKSYHVGLRRWAENRREVKQKLLQEEATVAARRRLQQIADDQKKSRFTHWLWRKGKNSYVEPGPGFMVARIKREKKIDELIGPRPVSPQAPQGLYLYGNVGCGKTLLMDLFFNASEGVVEHRRRVHFHAAMLEVHQRMHKHWSQGRHRRPHNVELGSNSPKDLSTLTLEDAAKEWLEAEARYEHEQQSEGVVLEAVADELLGSSDEGVGGASLLCFDEVQVVDVFTAVALSAILGRLLRRGAVIVATSNRAPSDLNKEGMQKEIFAAFVAELEHHCRSILVGVDTDYRRVMATPVFAKTNYFWPLGCQSQLELEQKWDEITTAIMDKSTVSVGMESIPVMFGRELQVPESCNGVARFTFEQVCDRPVGAADYIALAQNYHTVFITDIPIMSMRIHDKARRFITLVDELYNHRCRLICTADAPPDDLFLGTLDGPIIDLESLQFETEAESSRLRRDVQAEGSVAPLGVSKEDKASIHSLLSGREELFAFRRAVSRLMEMQTPVYLKMINCHPKFQEESASVSSAGG
ncbi:unnamed protein product [Sphagnum troendelagicum]|uniref:AFG1-like ATPase n=1 Tax=Sphagnum troendelagicum TaxID=128251 RepID=A0ABP0TME6_9BRYO